MFIKNVFSKSASYRKFLLIIIFNTFFIFSYLTYNFYHQNQNQIKISTNVNFIIENNNNNNNNLNLSLDNNINIKSEDYYTDDYYKLLLEYIIKWKNSLKIGNSPLLTHLNTIDLAHELIIKEQQLTEFNITKRPVALNDSLNCNNLNYNSFLKSTYRQKPVRITDLILISYELVVIEMRLFELYDIVDEIIIFETNITFKQVAKPFFFLSNLARYRRFLDKIVLITPFNITRFNKHDLSIKSKINVNPEEIPNEYKVPKKAPEAAFNKDHSQFFRIDFTIEQRARMMPLSLYEKYVRRLDDNELVIHGDLDEMPSGTIINHFKYCDVIEEKYPYQFWSTFYIYGFNYLFRADFAAPGDPYSNAFPNIFRMKDIRKIGKIRVTQAHLLPRASGCHCNRFFSGFTISLYKDMSQSDSEGLEEFHSTIIQNSTIEACYDIKRKFASGNVYRKYFDRMKLNKGLQAHEKIFIPWIVENNKHVYKQYISS